MSKKRMANVQSAHHNFFFSVFLRTRYIYILLILGIYHLFSGNSSHSDCHSSNIYLFVHGFRSENRMSSTEKFPSWACLAAESAAEFPLMPTWPGTQMKTISLPSLVISVYNSKIWTKTGWWYFRFNIDCNNERESDNIKKYFSLE